MTEREQHLQHLLRNVGMAANWAAIQGASAGWTSAECTNAAVRAAFECAIGNGLVELVAEEHWPRLVSVQPPYDPMPFN